jgi:hypothetical protein
LGSAIMAIYRSALNLVRSSRQDFHVKKPS